MKSAIVQEWYKKLQINNDLMIVDVREHSELEICQLENATHLPMGDIPVELNQLDCTKDYVITCYHGIRSARAVQFMEANGFGSARNLTGTLMRG